MQYQTPTIQQQLFALLDAEQRKIVAKNLWPLKGCAQVILCECLIDFILYGEVHEPQNVVLSIIYSALTGVDMEADYQAPLYPIPDTRDPREGILPNTDFDKKGRSSAATFKSENPNTKDNQLLLAQQN